MRGKKCLSCMMAAVLAVSLVPVAPVAADDGVSGASEPGWLAGQVQRAVRAWAIDEQPDGAYVDGEILVVYKDDVSAEAAAEAPVTLPDTQAEVIAEGAADDDQAVARVEVPEGMTVGEAVAAAEDDPDVAYAQPNRRYYPLEEPGELMAQSVEQARVDPMSVSVDDPFAQVSDNNKSRYNQWWLSAVRAQDAWEYAKCDNKVTVAVLDTGINFEHEDLADNILADYAWDATADGRGAPLTESPDTSALSHGSHVAGITAAVANNGRGIAGASYNANILPIGVFTVQGSQAGCDDADLVKAYNYLMSDEDGNGKTVAEETNTHVINMSLGGYGSESMRDDALHAAIVKAEGQGILTCAAGGNGDEYGNPRTDNSYPSDYAEVMSVVALETPESRVSWSDYNDCKDIAAPGVNIWSTWWYGDEYYCTSGTSMATPLVAGCAALLWAKDPDLTVAQVKDALYSTAVDLGAEGKDDYYGWGRIDIAAALESLTPAHITAERTEMGLTGTQVLTASEVANPFAAHTWKWSVRSGDAVTVDADSGLVTAVAKGSAVVHVEDAADPEMYGDIGITVTDITVPGGLAVTSDGVNYQMVLKWKAADGAVKYRVGRSTAKDGDYEAIATVEAQANAKTYSYADAKVKVATDYYYRVTPVGRLADGTDLDGATTSWARGFFTDKKALSGVIDKAVALAAGAVVSANGSDVLKSGTWTTQANLDKLNAAIATGKRMFANGAAKQITIDTAARKLNAAIAAYNAGLKAGKKTISIAGATVTLSKGSAAYTGKAQAGSVKSVKLKNGTVLGAANYTVSAASGKNAGSYKVTVTGKGDYSGTATATFKITQLANPLAVTAKSPAVTFNKSKNQTIKAAAAFTVSKAQGAVTYAKRSGNASVTVAKGGAITVQAGLKAGTYSIKVRVKAAGNVNYKSGYKDVTVKVKVK